MSIASATWAMILEQRPNFKRVLLWVADIDVRFADASCAVIKMLKGVVPRRTRT